MFPEEFNREFHSLRQFRNHLPLSFSSSGNLQYVEEHLDALIDNYELGHWSLAIVSQHLLFMCFVYSKLAQLSSRNPEVRETLITLLRGAKKVLPSDYSIAEYLFDLSVINEKKAMETFRLVGFHENEIDRLRNLVKMRDYCAHADGNLDQEKHHFSHFWNESQDLVDKIENTTQSHIQTAYADKISSLEIETDESINIISTYFLQNNLVSATSLSKINLLSLSEQMTPLQITFDIHLLHSVEHSQITNEFLYENEITALYKKLKNTCGEAGKNFEEFENTYLSEIDIRRHTYGV